jgi:L-asparagine transporter-like permease
MEPKMKQEDDIAKIDKFTSYLLPNTFKIIGLVVVVTSFLLIVTSSKKYLLDDKYHDLFERIALSGTVLGLLLISISKEKMEDELITKIRTQSYNYAVIGTVLFYLTFPFINYIFFSFVASKPKIEGSSDVSVLGVLLFMQILTFRKLKRGYYEE